MNSPLWYHGDSLGCQFPSNIDRLVSLLQQIQTVSGLTIMCPNIRCELLHYTSGSFEDEFKINIGSDREVKEWVKKKADNGLWEEKVTKGKRASTKYFFHSHHKQRQTGKHQKSNRILKTVVREHSIKHTNCSAKMNISVLPSTTCGSFGVAVTLFYKHNHPINAGDALRFRPISEDVQTKYFNQIREFVIEQVNVVVMHFNNIERFGPWTFLSYSDTMN